MEEMQINLTTGTLIQKSEEESQPVNGVIRNSITQCASGKRQKWCENDGLTVSSQ